MCISYRPPQLRSKEITNQAVTLKKITPKIVLGNSQENNKHCDLSSRLHGWNHERTSIREHFIVWFNKNVILDIFYIISYKILILIGCYMTCSISTCPLFLQSLSSKAPWNRHTNLSTFFSLKTIEYHSTQFTLLILYWNNFCSNYFYISCEKWVPILCLCFCVFFKKSIFHFYISQELMNIEVILMYTRN